VRDATARRLRDLLVGDPTANKPPVAKLSEVCRMLFPNHLAPVRGQQQEALRWLDLLSGTRSGNGQAFLPPTRSSFPSNAVRPVGLRRPGLYE